MQNTCADALFRSPPCAENQEDDGEIEVDVSDKAFEINTFNSNQFNPKHFASCEYQNEKKATTPIKRIGEFDMSVEQQKDSSIQLILKQLQSGKENKLVQKCFIIIDQIVYYITNVDDEPITRLYVPEHIKEQVIKQYHDDNGHMGIHKVLESLKLKYYWPNMFKELLKYTTDCITCQMRSARKIQPPIQETDIPTYPFRKIGLDLSGQYPTSLSGNKYIVGFIDLYSG